MMGAVVGVENTTNNNSDGDGDDANPPPLANEAQRVAPHGRTVVRHSDAMRLAAFIARARVQGGIIERVAVDCVHSSATLASRQ